MKMIDLTGQNFGELIVLCREGSERNRPLWKCQCSCGNICYKTRDYLKGKTKIKSCGCQKSTLVKEFNQTKIKDLKNQRFGKLLVIEDSGKRQNGNVIWKCQCDCGNICEVSGNRLQKGDTKSCGCLIKEFNQTKIKDLTGQRFGKLVVIEDSLLRYDNNVIWKCQCDCGNICEVKSHSLISGNTKSCGCIESVGEFNIEQLLKENNIAYKKQYTNDTCRFADTNALAKFDFYINNNYINYIIEYDGQQHYIGWSGNEKNLLYVQSHDKYKNQWCKDNNVPLIRIPYWHLKDLCIEDLLLETSQFIIE